MLAERFVDERGSLLAVGEQEHLGGAWVFVHEGLVVIGRNFNCFVLDELSSSLLQRIFIQRIADFEVLGWDWELWVDFDGWERGDALFKTDRPIFIAVNGSNPEYALVLRGKLLECSLDFFRFAIYTL